MAWILVMYEQYPVLFAMCIQAALLVAVIGCFSMCQRRNARTARPVQPIPDAINADSPSPRAFNRPLNITTFTCTKEMQDCQRQAHRPDHMCFLNLSQSQVQLQAQCQHQAMMQCLKQCHQVLGPRQRQSGLQGGWTRYGFHGMVERDIIA